MNVLYIIIALLISYLIGAIPFGYLIPKIFKGIDIREHGSKNVGATNVIRVLGLKYGLPTFLLDMAKGAIPIVVVRYLLGFNELNFINNFDIVIIYGLASALGHMFSPFIGFKGGKAVATGVGAVTALYPIIGVSAILLCLVVAYLTKYVSLGSVVATLCVGVSIWLQELILGDVHTQIINLSFVTFLVILIIYKHKKNFIRLFNGTENKIGQKKKPDVDATIDQDSQNGGNQTNH